MAKLNFILLCENAFVTEGTKNLNLIGIFDTIQAEGFPALRDNLVVVYSIEADKEGEHEIELRMKYKDNQLFSMKHQFNKKSIQNIANILSFIFQEPGEYKVEVFIDNEPIGEKILTVKKI
jgi:cold shock CspA family protein